MSAASELPTHALQVPPARIRPLQNGRVLISVGEFQGIAATHHQTARKLRQLHTYWLKRHNPAASIG
tara:strand:- start:80 stop:280 length:201 start_codon:yes stop_codon:yes gene_type:complete